MHKHLFASLLIYAILSSLLKLNLLMKRSEDASDSDGFNNSSSLDLYCLILSLSLRYFRSTTYLCMFNEAYYLYQLIKKVFKTPSVTPLIWIAYLIPFAMTGTYVAARSLLPISSIFDSSLTSTANGDGTSSTVTLKQLPSIKVDYFESTTTTTKGPFESELFTTNSIYDVVNSTTTTADWVNVTGEIKEKVEVDPCWMLPARDSWKEWIINGPNLAMLLVSEHLFDT